MNEILEEALKLALPSEEEIQKANKAEKEIRRRLQPLKIDYLFVGSYARNTWLRGNLELDVFILFPTELSKKELESRIIEIGKKVFEKFELRYAEHPYVHGELLGVEFDLVPCYKVESAEKIISAVDRTPFHHEWLKDRIKGKENEVRLLKLFLKANGIYGAEYRVKGFSGYLCELLIVFYGSFIECLKNARDWSRKTVIDLKKNEIRTGEFFFVVDPVDEKRNVAANLSIDNLAKFVHLARLFLEKPSIEFFVKKKREIQVKKVLESIELRGTEIFALEFEKPDIVDDNLYPQLERAGRKVYEMLKREGFMPLRFTYFVEEKCYLLFECQVKELSKITRKLGPVFEDHENVKKFVLKERMFESFIEEGRWWAFDFRRHTKPEEAVSNFVFSNYQALGKNVGLKIKEGFRILKGEELLHDPFIERLAEFLGVRE
ncbi:MAG: CCA tRNA nucleotidyltransferase [Archaeoglobaceae archaeon]|nr:CCA tRNA nucleotidyltransferase [Archaeoglobaceae archaeon]MDW8118320.1 CCA tRNA nucleotidyltransferase [Archaeoglobaceae archaeon]